ncbi:MAG: proteasome assembly chaperone family protein [Candidatus Bathyarchaeia archaeon]|nr:proteasome assembly chaperone family protein [Candidatus Bathyarchaeota archaeon]
MKKTIILEKEEIELKNPILIEGLPGLGMVGRIAVKYLIRQFKARKFAELYSPHFAYYVLVDEKGNINLLKNEFYYWKNDLGENDLILLTGDSQAQTIEGQYEVADATIEFAKKKGVKLVITIGGYRKDVVGTPQVFVSATSPETLKKALDAGAISSPPGSPIVGAAGLLLGLAKFRGIEGICLLGETPGYIPDPRAAKSVLSILMGMLNLRLDLTDLDREIERIAQIEEQMRRIEEQRRMAEREIRKMEEEKISYIG